MTDQTLARDYAARLRATANGVDHVDEESELLDLAQLLDRLGEQLSGQEKPAPDDYQGQARAIVREYATEHLDRSDPEVTFGVFVVWFSKTLRNWKALVSTTLPDGRYYEVTHNGATGETYLDAYVKLENRVIR